MAEKVDLVLNMVNNPEYSLQEMYNMGLTPETTSIANKEDYYNSETIRNSKLFLDDKGEFNQEKFDTFYDDVQAANLYITKSEELNKLNFKAEYAPDNLLAYAEGLLVKDTNKNYFIKNSITLNPLFQSRNLTGFGELSDPVFSAEELAQTQLVWDPTTQTWHESPNDRWFTDYWDTLVLAQWEDDKTHKDPVTGETVQHRKGELKLNANGTYYYELLAGRDPSQKMILHKLNTLTNDGSFWNKFDPFDSDSVEAPGVVKTLFKNGLLVGTMFIPYVGPVIAAASMLNNVANFVANMGKAYTRATSGEDSPFWNQVEGWTNSMNRQYLKHSDSAEHPFSFCNFIDVTADLMGQLREQRVLFEFLPTLLGKGELYANTWGKSKAAAAAASEAAQLKFTSKLFAKNLESVQTSVKKLIAAHPDKYATDASRLMGESVTRARLMTNAQVALYMKESQRIGAVASKMYMAALISTPIYNEAINSGVGNTEAGLLTLGRFSAEMALLNTPIGDYLLPEIRAGRMQLRAMLKHLIGVTEDNKSTIFNQVREAGGRSLNTAFERNAWAQKVFQWGTRLVDKGAEVAAALKFSQAIVPSFVNGFETGLVNDIEEFLSDLTRSAHNTVAWIRGDDSRMNAWDNMGERYGMGMASGLVGGTITAYANNYKMLKQPPVTNSKEAWAAAVNTLRTEPFEKFQKDVESTDFGYSAELSATKYHTDKDTGEIIWEKASSYEDSLEYAAKKIILNQARAIKQIIENEGCNISDRSLLDRNSLVQLRWEQMGKTGAASRLISEWNSVIGELAQVESKIKEEYSKRTDKETRDEESKKEFEAKIKPLEQKRDELLKKKDDLLNGNKTMQFMSEAFAEMSPDIINGLVPVNFQAYAELKTHKAFKDIDLATIENLKRSYDVFAKEDRPNKIAEISLMLISAAQHISPELQASAQLYEASLKDDSIAMLRTMISVLNPAVQASNQLSNQKDASETDWLAIVQKTINQVLPQFAVLHSNWTNSALALQYADYQQQQQLLQDLLQQLEKALEDPNITPENRSNTQVAIRSTKAGIQLSSNNMLVAMQDYVASYAINIVDALKKQGWVSPIVRETLSEIFNQTTDLYRPDIENIRYDIETIKSILDPSSGDLGYAENPKFAKYLLFTTIINDLKDGFIGQDFVITPKDIDMSSPEALVNSLKNSKDQNNALNILQLLKPWFKQLEELRNELPKLEEQLEKLNSDLENLEELITTLESLPSSPVTDALLKLSVATTGEAVSLLDLLLQLHTAMKDAADKNIENFTLDKDALVDKVKNARNLITLFKSVLQAAKTDNLYGENLIGFNHIVNESAKKAGVANWVDLAELNSTSADAMLADLRQIDTLLSFYESVYQINKGQKLLRLNKVEVVNARITFEKTRGLFEDLAKDSDPNIASAANAILDKFNSSTILNKILSDKENNTLSENEMLQLMQEDVEISDLIYNFVNDENIGDLATEKLLRAKYFNLFNSEFTLLNEGTKSIDDSSYLGWLLPRLAVKASSFYKKYSLILKIDGDSIIAPIPTQAACVYLNYAKCLQHNKMSKYVQTLRNSIRDLFIELTPEERKKMLPDLRKEFFQNKHANNILMAKELLLLENLILTEGIAGAGKTSAVMQQTYELLKLDEKLSNILKNAVAVHGGDAENAPADQRTSKAKALAETLSGNANNEFHCLTIRDLIKNISESDLKDFYSNTNRRADNLAINTNDFTFTTSKGVQSSAINPYTLIIIDEATNLALDELVVLNRYAQETGAVILLAGDFDQTTKTLESKVGALADAFGLVDKKTGKSDINATCYLTASRTAFLHSTKLGVSMRTTNTQKDTNNAALLILVSERLNGKLVKTTPLLSYYYDNTTFNGDLIVDTVDSAVLGSSLTADEYFNQIYNKDNLLSDSSDLMASIDAMVKASGDEKILFVGFSSKSPLFDKLNTKYPNKFEGIWGTSVLGLEASHYIIEMPPAGKVIDGTKYYESENDDSYIRDLYTYITRAKDGSIVIGAGKSVLKPIRNISALKDAYTQVETYDRSALKSYTTKTLARMKVVSENAKDPAFTAFEKPQPSTNQPVQQQPVQPAASSTGTTTSTTSQTLGSTTLLSTSSTQGQTVNLLGQTGQNNPGAQSTNPGLLPVNQGMQPAQNGQGQQTPTNSSGSQATGSNSGSLPTQNGQGQPAGSNLGSLPAESKQEIQQVQLPTEADVLVGMDEDLRNISYGIKYLVEQQDAAVKAGIYLDLILEDLNTSFEKLLLLKEAALEAYKSDDVDTFKLNVREFNAATLTINLKINNIVEQYKTSILDIKTDEAATLEALQELEKNLGDDTSSAVPDDTYAGLVMPTEDLSNNLVPPVAIVEADSQIGLESSNVVQITPEPAVVFDDNSFTILPLMYSFNTLTTSLPYVNGLEPNISDPTVFKDIVSKLATSPDEAKLGKSKRIDNGLGLLKLLAQFGGTNCNPISLKRCLIDLQNAIFSATSRQDLNSFISGRLKMFLKQNIQDKNRQNEIDEYFKLLNLSSRFVFINTPAASIEKNIADIPNGNDKLRVHTDEPLIDQTGNTHHNVWAPGRRIALVIGDPLAAGFTDFLEIYGLTMENPDTFLRDYALSFKYLQEAKLADNSIKIDPAQETLNTFATNVIDSSASLWEAVQANRHILEKDPETFSLVLAYIDLYLHTQEGVVNLDLMYGTDIVLNDIFKNKGLQIISGEHGKDYRISSNRYEYTPEYHTLLDLKDALGVNISDIYETTTLLIIDSNTNSPLKDASTGNEFELIAGKPFVFFTYDHGLSSDDMAQRFFQQLKNPALPRTVNMALVLPPSISVKEYLEGLHKLINLEKPDMFGNDVTTAFDLVAKLFKAAQADENGPVMSAIKNTMEDRISKEYTHNKPTFNDFFAAVITEIEHFEKLREKDPGQFILEMHNKSTIIPAISTLKGSDNVFQGSVTKTNVPSKLFKYILHDIAYYTSQDKKGLMNTNIDVILKVLEDKNIYYLTDVKRDSVPTTIKGTNLLLHQITKDSNFRITLNGKEMDFGLVGRFDTPLYLAFSGQFFQIMLKELQREGDRRRQLFTIADGPYTMNRLNGFKSDWRNPYGIYTPESVLGAENAYFAEMDQLLNLIDLNDVYDFTELKRDEHNYLSHMVSESLSKIALNIFNEITDPSNNLEVFNVSKALQDVGQKDGNTYTVEDLLEVARKTNNKLLLAYRNSFEYFYGDPKIEDVINILRTKEKTASVKDVIGIFIDSNGNLQMPNDSMSLNSSNSILMPTLDGRVLAVKLSTIIEDLDVHNFGYIHRMLHKHEAYFTYLDTNNTVGDFIKELIEFKKDLYNWEPFLNDELSDSERKKVLEILQNTEDRPDSCIRINGSF